MNNLLKLSAVILVIMISVGIGFNVYNKNNELKQKKEDLRLEFESTNRKNINRGLCFDRVDADYKADWNSSCYSNGLSMNCGLPVDVAKNLTTLRDKAKAFCFELYPVE